jgi:hypothetical protein
MKYWRLGLGFTTDETVAQFKVFLLGVNNARSL